MIVGFILLILLGFGSCCLLLSEIWFVELLVFMIFDVILRFDLVMFIGLLERYGMRLIGLCF